MQKYISDYSGIPAKLRELRLDAGYPIKYMAEQMGVSPSAVSAWEQGINGMTLNAFSDYCRVLGIDIIVEFRNTLHDLTAKR